MFDFDSLSHAITSQTVLCVGDLMLDEFVYGEVSRISPEAPAPGVEREAGRRGQLGERDVEVAGKVVEVHYVGVSWSTGEQFDASWDNGKPFPFRLGAVEQRLVEVREVDAVAGLVGFARGPAAAGKPYIKA